MLVRPDHLLKLIEGMEARISKGFRVCPETAPLMVEALRLYARMHAIEPANFRVEKWDWRNQHVEEVVASTSLLMVGRAAFEARDQYSGSQLTLARDDAAEPLLRYAFTASGSQILILRVSGIRNRLSTKHTAGTAIG